MEILAFLILPFIGEGKVFLLEIGNRHAAGKGGDLMIEFPADDKIDGGRRA